MDGGTKPNSLKTQDRRRKGGWLAEQVCVDSACSDAGEAANAGAMGLGRLTGRLWCMLTARSPPNHRDPRGSGRHGELPLCTGAPSRRSKHRRHARHMLMHSALASLLSHVPNALEGSHSMVHGLWFAGELGAASSYQIQTVGRTARHRPTGHARG